MDWLVFLYFTKYIYTWLFVLCHVMTPWSSISCILKFYSPNHLSLFRKIALDLVLHTKVLVLPLCLSVVQEFNGAHFMLERTQRDSGLEATKCLAKYPLMKVICYNIIQNKSWLTYLLELFLKEIIHKAERCEAVNIIYIDWGKDAVPQRRQEQGASNKLREHCSGKDKDLSEGLCAVGITAVGGNSSARW